MIISFLNEKGGVGKSTITSNLAAFMAEVHSSKVLIVDTDKQGSLRDWHAMYSEAKGDNCQIDLTAADTSSAVKTLPNISENYNFVLVDGAGKAGLADVSIEAIKNSDLVIIPVQPSKFDLWGSTSIYEAAQTRRELTGKPDIYLLFNRVNERTDIFKDSCNVVDDNELPILNSFISQRVSFCSLTSQGKSVVDLPESKAFKEIESLCNEITTITNQKFNTDHNMEKQSWA